MTSRASLTNKEETPVDDGGLFLLRVGFGLGEQFGLLCLELFVGDVTGVT
jgi:hypothetical protein